MLSVAGLHLLHDEIDRKSPRLFLLDFVNSVPGDARRKAVWLVVEAVTEFWSSDGHACGTMLISSGGNSVRDDMFGFL